MLMDYLIPELALFPNRRDARKAVRTALSENLWRARVIIWVLCILPTLIWIRDGCTIILELRGSFFTLIYGAFSAWIFLVGVKLICLRDIKRNVWRQLLQFGVILCQSCGYQLTSDQRRCPECGLPCYYSGT